MYGNDRQYYKRYIALVSYPDPTLCEGKGLVDIERFLGLAAVYRHVTSHMIATCLLATDNSNLDLAYAAMAYGRFRVC